MVSPFVNNIQNDIIGVHACGHWDKRIIPHQVLSAPLTLFQLGGGGADFAHSLLLSPPFFPTSGIPVFIAMNSASERFKNQPPLLELDTNSILYAKKKFTDIPKSAGKFLHGLNLMIKDTLALHLYSRH